MTRVHPAAHERVLSTVERSYSELLPPPEDPVELARSAAELGWSVDELREARADYQPWDTVDEWRQQIAGCMASDVWAIVNVPGPRSWRRWRLTRFVLGQLYAIGIVSGYGIELNWSGSYLSGSVSWSFAKNRYTDRRSRPVYVLWLKSTTWRCLLRRHHWPSPYQVGFGMCARCCPCPECGKPAPLEHECTGVTS